MKKSLLFIGHEASRSGAPILLLNFLRWLKHNTDIPFLTLLGKTGELEPEYRALGPTFVLSRGYAIKRKPLERRLQSLLLSIEKTYRLHKLKKHLLAQQIGLVYSNTITNGSLLHALSYLNCPVVTHVHELEVAIRYFGASNLELVRRFTQCYVAVSDAVKRNLVRHHGIHPDAVEVIHGFISIGSEDMATRQQLRPRLLSDLNIPEESMIVGACGAIGLNKGPDLFIELAHSVLRKHPGMPVHFILMGSDTEGLRSSDLYCISKRLGLDTVIHFIGSKPNPLDYISVIDVFALVSREDSFPLVILEAASLGKPLVCFDGSGGAKEFIGRDCGFVLPYLDIEAMARSVIDLLRSSELRLQFGKRASQKVIQRHRPEILAPRVLQVIMASLEGR